MITCLIAFLIIDALGLAFALWHVKHAAKEEWPGQYG